MIPGCSFKWSVKPSGGPGCNRLSIEREGLKLHIEAGSRVEVKSWTNLLNFTIESPLPDRFKFDFDRKPKKDKSRSVCSLAISLL